MTDVCEGVWRGYLDIYGSSELSTLGNSQGRLRRRLPLVTERPRPLAETLGYSHPVRLTVMHDV